MAPTDTYNVLMSRFKKPNRLSMDRQQMQGQVYNTPGVTAPAKPALTAADVEADKGGTNGDVVQLGDAKPAAASTTPSAPATSTTQATTEVKPKLSPDAVKPAMPATQVAQKPVGGVDTSPKNLKEWIVWYNERRRRLGLETEADREKRERRENAERMIAAIGDGVSALAQIHAASKGAVVNPGTGTSLMEGVAKRHERLRRERDANDTKLLSYLRERRNSELAERKAKREEQRAEQAAKHQAAQEKYWDEQAKRWANADEVARQRAEEQARANKAREEETKRNHDITEKGKNDRAAASRAAANSRNKYNQSQQTARQREREAAKDKRAKEKQQSSTKKTLPGQTKPKTKKKLPK